MEMSSSRRRRADEEEEEKMKVMVALDGEDESFYALQWVLDNLLSQNHHGLTLIHVVQPYFPLYAFTGIPVVYPCLSTIHTEGGEKQHSEIMHAAQSMCSRKKITAKTMTVVGDPKEMICKVAEQMGTHLLVLGLATTSSTRGLGNFHRALMGSVSEYVWHNAKCPVLVVNMEEEADDDDSTTN